MKLKKKGSLSFGSQHINIPSFNLIYSTKLTFFFGHIFDTRVNKIKRRFGGSELLYTWSKRQKLFHQHNNEEDILMQNLKTSLLEIQVRRK